MMYAYIIPAYCMHLKCMYKVNSDGFTRDLGMQYNLQGNEMGITALSYCHLFLRFFGHS